MSTVVGLFESRDQAQRAVEALKGAGLRAEDMSIVMRDRGEASAVAEEVEVERVPVNRLVEGPVAVRQEGDTTIVPLVEEILVVEKRLMLKEELRITKRRVEEHAPQRITLRTEEATVERIGTQERPETVE